MVTSYIHFVAVESLMIHAQFQDHLISDSGESLKDFTRNGQLGGSNMYTQSMF